MALNGQIVAVKTPSEGEAVQGQVYHATIVGYACRARPGKKVFQVYGIGASFNVDPVPATT